MSNDLNKEIEVIKRIEGRHKKRKHAENDIRNITENDTEYIDDEERLNKMKRTGFGLYNYKCPCDQVGTGFDINEHNKTVEEQKQVFKDVKNFIFINMDKHEVIYEIPMEAFFDNIFDEYNHITKLCANKNADIIAELHNGQRMPFDVYKEGFSFKNLFNKAKDTVTSVVNKVEDTMDSVLEKFDIKGIFNDIWEKIQNIGESILKPIGTALTEAMDWLVGTLIPGIIKIVNDVIVTPFISPVVKSVVEPVKTFVKTKLIPLAKIIIPIIIFFLIFWYIPQIFQRLGFWLVNCKLINNTLGRLLIIKPESVKIMHELYSIQSKLDSLTKGDKEEGEEKTEDNKDENKDNESKDETTEEDNKEEQQANETEHPAEENKDETGEEQTTEDNKEETGKDNKEEETTKQQANETEQPAEEQQANETEQPAEEQQANEAI